MLIETIIINRPINKSPNIIADISMIITEDFNYYIRYDESFRNIDMMNHSGTYNK